MGLDETLKNVLGDEVYKEKGKQLKQELAKEMIPKTEFNAKIEELKSKDESIKALESEKRLALEELENKKNENLSEVEKLQKSFKKLEDTLNAEKKAREDSENKLKDVETTNSLKSLLNDSKMRKESIDDYVQILKNVEEDKREETVKQWRENKKYLFGEDVLEGKKPEGKFDDNKPSEIPMPKTIAEWKKTL